MKQIRVKGIGELYEAFVVALPILSAVQFISILIVLYDSVKEYMLPTMPWITLWHFFGMVVTAMLIGMVLVYKFLIPSVWNFRQRQMFNHESQVAERIERIEKILNEINGKGKDA